MKNIELYVRGFFSGVGQGIIWLSHIGSKDSGTAQPRDTRTGQLIYPRDFIGALPANARYETWWEAYSSHVIVIGLVGIGIWFLGRKGMVSDL